MTEAAVPQADTPVSKPPTRLERVKAFIGDLARPFSIYASAGAASTATVMFAYAAVRAALHGNVDLIGAAAFIGAVWAGVAGLYWGKAWEVHSQAKQTAAVEVAKVQAAPAATDPTPPQLPPLRSAPAADLPPWERQR